ncbi:thioesterase II family protein [Nonomuraea endophytica]|uniref:thioesterase II family protein n=1 Tax=Nonomuraea endophytica TaxID=714136 RepID=UPI0037CB202C
MSDWLQPIREQGRDRFVFFPSAGSSASAALALADAVPDGWSLWSVQYPGRGPRLREPQAASVREIAVGCLPELLRAPGRLLLFGHSFGAFAAYDTAQLLAAKQRPAAGLVVSGSAAPGSPMPDLSAERLSAGSLIASLTRQGGTAAELLDNEELMELVLPALRADLALGRQYVDDHPAPLTTPVLALAGRHDPVMTEAHLATWRRHTAAWLGCESNEGDHFFYLQDPAVLAGAVDRHWRAA